MSLFELIVWGVIGISSILLVVCIISIIRQIRVIKVGHIELINSSCIVCQSQTKHSTMCNKCQRIVAHNYVRIDEGLEPDEGSRELIAVSRRLYDSARFREIIGMEKLE